jgi:UDP:flavonoid glycosyltransferase YjiC (YdhE family)
MRLLFVSLGSVGHTYPLVPLAIAARDAGHDVRFAAGENVHAPLAANGLRPFRPADSFYEIYAEDLAPELTRLSPDLVVHGWGVPGAAEAAKSAGIPSLWHGFGRLMPPGIGFDRPLGTGLPHLDICPPSLQDKEFLATEDRISLRPVPFSEPGPLPTVDSSRPLVYLTLGTAFGTPEVLTTAIAGLTTVDAQVVVATGRVRPAELGPLPEGVFAQSWVPQAELLPRADVVVHHGGSGTTLGALAAGVPQLVLPQGADQFANAEALTGAGAALSLTDVTAEAVADATRALFGPDHRDAARTLAAEVAAMPGPADVVGRLRDHT